MNVIALITAAGSSTRMNNNIPKQFIHIENKPLILYTLEVFQNHPSINSICITVVPEWEAILMSYAKQYKIDKLKHIVYGGRNGQESICNGIHELSNYYSSDTIIMIHDGNRPLITSEIISDSLVVYKKNGCAVAAIPCIEAIYRSKDGVRSDISIPREELYRTQTPHTYSLGDMVSAHDKALERGIFDTTATCTLMSAFGKVIYFSQGSERNLKITTQEDLEIFKSYLSKGEYR